MGLIFDIVGVAFIIAMVILVPSVLYMRHQQKLLNDPKRRVLDQATNFKQAGEVNVVKMTVDRERLCSLCGKFTDPATDLFLAEKWTHRSCYEAPTTSVT